MGTKGRSLGLASSPIITSFNPTRPPLTPPPASYNPTRPPLTPPSASYNPTRPPLTPPQSGAAYIPHPQPLPPPPDHRWKAWTWIQQAFSKTNTNANGKARGKARGKMFNIRVGSKLRGGVQPDPP